MIGISSLPTSKVIDSLKVLASRQYGIQSREQAQDDCDIQNTGLPIKATFLVRSNLFSGCTRHITMPKDSLVRGL